MKIAESARFSFDRLRRVRPDVFLLIGLGLITYGAFQIYEPVGFVVGGFAAISIGIIDSYVAALKKRIER